MELIANKHQGRVSALNLLVAQFYLSAKSAGTNFTAACPDNQDFWIATGWQRYQLTDSEVKLTVPASRPRGKDEKGNDGCFSTGDPWSYRIVTDKIGFIAALTAEMWKNHPEEYFLRCVQTGLTKPKQSNIERHMKRSSGWIILTTDKSSENSFRTKLL